MKNDDVQLIQRVLDGDETAFSMLVKKYQRSVHALAWRKIGDFHIAEDITQETFLKAYQKLSTLKEPQSFTSWLYVIAANCCKAWRRKKHLWTQPLETAGGVEMEKATYSGYISAENARTMAEAQREVVKKLLAKLQESERTVITLYYLGGMTYEEISKFLGVSVAAIKNRLYRARNRLKKEEPMIREALGNFQITPNLTENIMQEISRLKPIAPSGGKPLVPWGTVGISTIAVIFLMLGVGTEYLSRFQKPYSFDATSEMTVDIIETPVVLDIESKPDVQTQLGSTAAPSQNEGAGQRPDEVLFAAAQSEGEDVSAPKQQWIQAQPVKGSDADGLLATPEGEFYASADMQIYKLEADGNGWQHLFDFNPLGRVRPPKTPIAKWENTLYVMLANEFYASKDDGQTWDLVHTLPDGHYDAIGLILTEQAFYAAFDTGIFRSEDNGKTWQAINDGLMMGDMGYIRSIVNIQDTLFAGTGNGFYRFGADSWQSVEFPVSVSLVRSVAATEKNLYVAAEISADPRAVLRGEQQAWWIFRSTDLGNSWDDITPTNAWAVKGWPPFVKLIAAGDTLLAMEQGMVRSTDGGNTWLPTQLPGTSPSMNADVNIAIAVNENVFYAGSGEDGLYRSTDAGKSWDMVNINLDTGQIGNLIAYRENSKADNMPLTLYARYEEEKVLKTTDRGASWQEVRIEIPMAEPDREGVPAITHIIESGSKIYAKGGDSLGRGKTRIYRVSTDDNSLVPIQGMPIFDAIELWVQSHEIKMKKRNGSNLSDASVIKQLREKSVGAAEFFKQLAKSDPRQPDVYMQLGFRKGAFAVSGDTFYMEYNYKLFRWEPGDTEWYDTEQEETVELSQGLAFGELKLAASENTVYVGKRDGHLVVSFDKGNNWIDLTPSLPLTVKAFHDMVFLGSTVYVATDAGVAASSDGKQWRAITDATGTSLIIGRLAVDGTTLYGVSKTGVHQLKNGAWKEVASEVPERVSSLAVDGNVLYVGTQSSGVLHFNLNE